MGKKRSAYQPDFQEHPEANVNAMGFVPARSAVP
jgi:hypothetical protein